MSKLRRVSTTGGEPPHVDTRPAVEMRAKPNRTRAKITVRWKQSLVFLILWILTVQYFERWQVSSYIRACNWKNWEHWPSGATPHRLVMVGDPQLVDNYSYPSRNSFLLRITQKLSDNYLHRNHQIYHQILDPHTTLFIGDLFDGGREWSNPVWYDEYIRFFKVFNPIESARAMLQIPGNHDIGFGNGVEANILNRFTGFFGNPNDYFLIGNHSLVLLDTISLSSKDHPDINKAPTEFLASLSDAAHPSKKYPRILLSHVPLYRFTDKQSCGPLRESKKKFPVMYGKQYQTVIEYEISQRILNGVKPKLVLSGDDHDYCHIRHPLQNADTSPTQVGESFTDEITVKSSAMTGGIRKPAIQLLSLYNPLDTVPDPGATIEETGSMVVSHDTFQSRLCYLPDPYQSLRWYSFVIVLMTGSFVIIYVFPKSAQTLNERVKNRLGVIKPLFDDDLMKRQSFKMKLLDTALDWDIPQSPSIKLCALHVLASIAVYITVLGRYFNSI